VAFVIVFVKILDFNKIASIIGFVGIIFHLVGDSLSYFIFHSISGEAFLDILEGLGILGDAFYGIGLILRIVISDNIFFKNIGEERIKFFSQTQGSIKAIALDGIQAVYSFPSYITPGIN